MEWIELVRLANQKVSATKVPRLIRLKQEYINRCLNSGLITKFEQSSRDGLKTDFGYTGMLEGIPTVIDDSIENDYEVEYFD